MADNTEKLATLSNLSDHVAEIKRLLKQVRAYIDKKDGTKVDKVSGKQLSTNDYTTTEKNKLAGIESGAQKNTVTGVKGDKESSYRTGNVNITPANIGAAAASHTHAIADVTDLQTTLDGKAAASHKHAIADINNLQTTLDGKAEKSHTHSTADITDLNIPTYETLTLTVTAEDGSSVAGQKATINGAVYPLDSTGVIVANIPYGVEYVIELDAKSNYIKPRMMTFVSSQQSREVSMTYFEMRFGVFIQDKAHKLWSVSEWDSSNNSNANAVALITTNVKLLIDINDTYTLHIIDDYSKINYMYTMEPIDNEATSRYDFSGRSKTEKLVSLNDSTDYSPGFCWNYIFPDGYTHGHLPSIGEYNEIYLNIADINAAIQKTGGNQIDISDSGLYYQSSTLYGLNANNRVRFQLFYLFDGSLVMCPNNEFIRPFRIVSNFN